MLSARIIKVADEADNYRHYIGGYSGTAGNL